MFDYGKIQTRIEEVAISQAKLSAVSARDSAFHMTDWFSDLEDFVDFCSRPDEWSSEDVDRMLLNFLVHAPNHIAAAAKLYANSPVQDIFEVGAVKFIRKTPKGRRR